MAHWKDTATRCAVEGCERSRRKGWSTCTLATHYGLGQSLYGAGRIAPIPDPTAGCWGAYELSLAELSTLPTLSQGQADDLKIESDTERVWLSRCTVEDGEPWDNKVTVERLIAGCWIEVEHWEAR